jgi:hypothetical protein
MNKRTTCGTLRAKLTQPRSPSVRARSLLISRLRKEKDPIKKERISVLLKQLETRAQAEDPAHIARLDQYIAHQLGLMAA